MTDAAAILEAYDRSLLSEPESRKALANLIPALDLALHPPQVPEHRLVSNAGSLYGSRVS